MRKNLKNARKAAGMTQQLANEMDLLGLYFDKKCFLQNLGKVDTHSYGTVIEPRGDG